MRPAGFSDVLHFVNKLVGKFTISRSNVQVGVVTFSSTPHLEFDLTRYLDDHRLHDAIHHISFTAHGTDTLPALKYVESSSFEHGRGARPDASHIVILITDGVVIHSSHYPSHQSGHVTPSSHHGHLTHSSHVQEGPAELDHIIGLMKTKGMDVIAIGVNVHNSNLLRRIARDFSNYFTVSNSSELTHRTNAVAQRICAGTRQRKITTTQVPSTTKTTHISTTRTVSTTPSTTYKVSTPSTTHQVTTSSTTHKVTTPSTTHKDLSCVDKVDNCYQFETYYCMPPYDTWARANCPAYCGYCNDNLR
ncbi:uncharacterized protein LOC134270322 [Saccostrea cucullata]|uniref:uncharacterized protein LOC134270322 n=1 Tax=Saccostrea cuccullata TaxID=36930 RepID=UPI002ED146DD